MPTIGPGRFPIAGQAQAPEEAWSWPPVAPRGEGDLEVSGFERSCASGRVAAGYRCARNRSALELGPYGTAPRTGCATRPLRLTRERRDCAPTAY